jgi:uncharacterized membrane protein YidH (DUF202 family)
VNIPDQKAHGKRDLLAEYRTTLANERTLLAYIRTTLTFFVVDVTLVKFVRDQHRKIRWVAAVTDSIFLTIVPNIAKHFVSAEIKHFDYDDMGTAKEWIKETT